jgi:Response regulator containing a CheY-like receiver domain and an HTH DNA-binding domain
MIHIGIAEDQALIRESLAIVLNLEPDLEVVWTSSTGEEALALMEQKPADVVLMDLRLPGIDGVTTMRRMKSRPELPLMIVLTTFHHEEWLIDAIHAGAAACFMKEVPPDLLITAIRELKAGSWHPPLWTPEWRKYAPEIQFRSRLSAGPAVPGKEPEEVLTTREVKIVQQLCAGATNKEIASELYLSEGTVKNYVSLIYAKLGARHRAEAIRLARERGYL